MQSHVEYFGDDWKEYINNEHYQAACGLEIVEIGEYIKRLSPEFLEEHDKIDWSGLIGLRTFIHIVVPHKRIKFIK